MEFLGRRIVILGLARQGVALARYLAARGARVLVSDGQPAEKLAPQLAALADLPIEYVLGGHPPSLLAGCDLLCLSGGVEANLPLAVEARARGIPLSNDSQIFLEVCPSPWTVGVTGSAGKTTTTLLTWRMLAAAAPEGGQAWLGGNIGHPLIGDVARIGAEDRVVMELSSFQLEIMTRSPRVGAILNITPNHLDRHGTLAAYTAAKARLLHGQGPETVAVLGWDNPAARDLARWVRGRTAFFSGEAEVAQGAFLRGETVVWRWAGAEHDICRVADIELRGRHNVLNVLAACAVSGAAGAGPEHMRAGVAGFTGVAHRLELVGERAGARWYNDSIASAPERVIAALQAFSEPVVLLLGGRDKKLPWGDLAALIQARAAHAVLFGEAGPMIAEALAAAGVPADRRTLVGPLAEAVPAAARAARPGDVVLLSPGCTSFDAFKDFADRGDQFKDMVRALP